MPYITINNIDHYYEEHGDGQPLVLINGLGCHVGGWYDLLPHLVKHVHVILYDMRNAGRTAIADTPFTVGDLADDLHALLASLNVPHANVLGFSMGGNVAIEYALRYPQTLDHLILVSTWPAYNYPHAFSTTVDELFHAEAVTPETLAAVYEHVYSGAYKKDHTVDGYLNRRMNDPYAQSLSAYQGQLAAGEGFDRRDDVSTISQPTLVVSGNEDGIIPVENSIWMHAHISGAQMVLLDDVGHMVPEESPQALSHIISSFIG